MAIKIIGAGFGRTGTLSLKLALERLGFDKCYHMLEVIENPDHRAYWSALTQAEPIDWATLFGGYQASVDWPSCNFWREQMQQYPEALVILSTRDPERWYASVMSTIYPSSVAARDSADVNMARFGQWVFDIIWQGVFDGRMEHKDHCLKVFREHEERVKAAVSQDRLLTFEAAQGWEPLCRFLGCAVPEEPYPRVNTTAEFLAGAAERSADTSQT